ncbi:prepilin-type N-terminal cleavage/methylation domain-containing protein [Anabaena sphaerica FACHB-251]|uniref:Prepilin-type N-terminal cleavage/methylation domain-containing protein n=1 Tax=Anabaena sphaerica FACHB-251 TaxID=2692883 RepID=A0A927A2F8_9NOST|nr:type IV pilin-like G/H family protein [Anabaena sphaerica]MBD2295328.1 prepilin-type N-terminal cleavage/methylation domain-containing protein [Anabaena sphaerica FACHB-251]
MKSDFKRQLLGYILPKKQDNAGFTLTELIIVTVIIGILSAIALPSILSRANKSKQTEAKLYTGSMNRAQQAYYLENTAFTTSIDNLGIGIQPQTENYDYNIQINNTVATNNGVSRKKALNSYVGVTYLNTFISTAGTVESVTITILCESPNTGVGTQQTMTSGVCPTGWLLLPK